MTKSKLENYEDMLCALVDRYLTVDGLAYKCGMDCIAVSKRLEFLVKNGLVQESRCNTKIMFSLTKRGTAIYKTLAITKRLDQMKTTIQMIDDALQALPALPENSEERLSRRHRNENY